MSNFSDVLKSVGFGVGAVSGGPSQVKTIAGLVKANSTVNEYLQSVGKKIGSYTGSNVFEAIAGGAKESADAETKAFVDTKVLSNATKTKITIGAVAILLVGGYFLYRGSK